MKNNKKDGSSKKSNKNNRLNAAADLLGNQKKKKSKQSKKAFDNLSLKDYKSVYASSEQQKKFVYLRKIIDAIEKVGSYVPKSIRLSKELKVDYRNLLNKAQLAAVTTLKGVLLVIAGAGTGKTRVIIYRTSLLLEKGVDPSRILLLTFTKKAADNMLKGVNELLQSDDADEVAGGTFHSFAHRVMKKHYSVFNLPLNYTIADVSESEDIIDLIRTDMGLNKKKVAFPLKGRIYEIISKSRNLEMTIPDTIDKYFSGIQKITDHTTNIEKVAEKYVEFKERSGTLDFDDLLERFRDGLKSNNDFRDTIRNHYQYTMIDEYQDTNGVQREIVDLLVNDDQNIMFVGDDAQSIYTWRGSKYENILLVPETYPDCKIIKLEENYRSSNSLLKFTNSIIDSFEVGYKKTLFSSENNHFKTQVAILNDEKKEAKFVVDRILELREANVDLKKIAVLCRSGKHWGFIESELTKRSIPYVTVGGIKLQEKAHIQDMTAHLKVLENPFNVVAWHRILKLIDGIAHISATKIVENIALNNGEVDLTEFSSKKYYKSLKGLIKMLEETDDVNVSVPDKLDMVKEYYKPILNRLHPDDATNRLLDIDVLVSFSKDYNDLDKLLSDFALEPPKKKFSFLIKGSKDESEEGKVVLSTVHSAKGLEWHTVFVTHANEGFFPSTKAMNDIEQLEEERRLFYVAGTRAMEKLYITMPWYVERYAGSISLPSRFLIEADRKTFKLKESKVDQSPLKSF